MSGERRDDFEVGYGKPPKHTRFRKGQSGNPSGRPKAKLNIRTVLEQALSETVRIKENGQARVITKLEAMFKQVVNQAAAGDKRAFKLLASLMPLLREAEATDDSTPDLEMDRQLMTGLVKRLQAAAPEAGQGLKEVDDAAAS